MYGLLFKIFKYTYVEPNRISFIIDSGESFKGNLDYIKKEFEKRRDYELIKARLYSKLHCNKFMREHDLSQFQHSVMFALAESRHFGIRKMCEFLKMIAKSAFLWFNI